MWRTTIAFVVAPAIGALVASLFAAIVWSIYLGFFFTALVIAYADAVVVGVPAFLLFRSRLPTSIWAYALSGAIVAAAVAVPIALFFPLVSGFLDCRHRGNCWTDVWDDRYADF